MLNLPNIRFGIKSGNHELEKECARKDGRKSNWSKLTMM
jgi:hypothetical protein